MLMVVNGWVEGKADGLIVKFGSLSDDEKPSGGGATPVEVFEVFVVDVVAINA